jgi:hypothetical protein
MLVAFAASARWSVFCNVAPGRGIELFQGALGLYWATTGPIAGSSAGITGFRHGIPWRQFHLYRWPSRAVRVSGAGSVGYAVLYIPLWMPFSIALMATIAPPLLRWRRRNLAALGLCASCRYDRRGLPPSARCPECGATPPT